MNRVKVPPAFHEAGFSGDFWLDATTDTPLLWGRMVPCLLGNSGWMALRVNDDDTVTVVRKDAAAVWEALTRAPVLIPVLTSPIAPGDWITGPRFRVAHKLCHDGDSVTTLCGKHVTGRIIHAFRDMPRHLACVRRSREDS